MKNLLSVSVIATVIFCFAACEEPVSAPLEYGNVRISFANDAGRTIYPSKIFDNYVYTFTRQSGSPQVMSPRDGVFALEIGSWNVRVDACVGAAVAATGAADFSLDAHEGKTVSIILQAQETTGYGTFKYHIQYPAGTTVEVFTLTKLPEMTTVLLNPVAGATAITGTVGNVPAGMYQLDMRFANGELKAGTIEIVHIYALLTTEYGTTQSPIVFEEKDFSNPIPITNAEIIITAPVKSVVPDTAADGIGHFSIGAVSWSPNDNPFLGGKVYTAAVTLTANSGYTFAKLSTVTVNGQSAAIANNTGDAVTLSYTFPETDTRTVTGIAIKTQPTKLTYTHGDQLDLTGLAVTLTHDDGTTEDIAAAAFSVKNITANPAPGNHLVYLEHNDRPVTIDYGYLTPITTVNLTVNPKVITFTINSISARTYTGSAQTPAVTVRDGTTALTPTTDYTVAYTNNTNAGTATVTITGVGNYAGSSGSTTFTINPKVMTFTVDSISARTYTGSAQTPAVTVRDGTTTLTQTTHYTAAYANNTNVGTATVTITGVGNYAGSTGSVTFTINKAAGAAVNVPVLNTRTHNSITINAVTAPSTGQSIEYGISTSNNANNAAWQSTLNFSGLTQNTTYYIFARAVGNNNYQTGAASGSLTVTTLQTGSAKIEYYWVDQHGSLVTTSDGVTNIDPGETLAITAQGDGYIVRQWYLNGVNTGQNGNTYNFSSMADGKHTVGLFVEKDGKLYNTNIIIVVAPYTVTFNANSATSGTAPSAMTANAGSSIILPGRGSLARTGYTFGGWNTNSSGTGTNYNTGASYIVNNSTTLYAKWVPNTRTVYIRMWDSGSDGWNTSAALRINVNGTNRAINASVSATAADNTPSGQRSTDIYIFNVATGDVVQIYWLNGGQYDKECAFAVYYSDDPPNPMFDPSWGTTGGKVLVSKRYNNPSAAVGNGTLMGSFTVQ